MTLNELEWLAKVLVSKQIDSAAYVHALCALFVEVPNIVDPFYYIWKYYK